MLLLQASAHTTAILSDKDPLISSKKAPDDPAALKEAFYKMQVRVSFTLQRLQQVSNKDSFSFESISWRW